MSANGDVPGMRFASSGLRLLRHRYKPYPDCLVATESRMDNGFGPRPVASLGPPIHADVLHDFRDFPRI